MSHEDAILAHARRDAPREACGVIAGGFVVPITNVSPEPETYFVMDEVELLRVYEQHGGIEGMYHSHPGGRTDPSSADRKYAPRGIPYYIATLDRVYEYVIA